MKRLFVLAAGVTLCFAALAQQYKWVDKDGKVQYGDAPPAGAKATPLRPPPGPSTPSAPSSTGGKPDKALSPDQAFQQRQKERQESEGKAAKADADAEAKRTNCANSQAQLAGLEAGERASTINSSGERVYLDDDQREREIARVRKAVADWCK